MFQKWMTLDGNHAMGSDDWIIEWQIDMEKQEDAGCTQAVWWNQAAMLHEDMEQADKLWRERAMGLAYLAVESTGNDVESEAEWCQKALGQALDTTTTKLRICTQSTSCFNGELIKRRSPLGRAIRRHRLPATVQGKAELQKSIRRANDRMLNYYLKNLRGTEV